MKPFPCGRWLLLGPALLFPASFAWCYFVAAGQRPEARVWYAVAKGFLLVWPLLCQLAFLRGDAPLFAGKRQAARSAGVGLVWGLGVLTLMAGAWMTPLGEGLRGGEGGGAVQSKLAQFGVTRDNYALVVLGFSLFHSALEEYFWRWFVFGQLHRVRPGLTAHLLAAAGFALHHYVALGVYFGFGTALWMGTAVAAGGWVWSWMYERWGSLAGPWISHVMVDLGMFGFGYLLLRG